MNMESEVVHNEVCDCKIEIEVFSSQISEHTDDKWLEDYSQIREFKSLRSRKLESLLD